jgi:hypothetical protein
MTMLARNKLVVEWRPHAAISQQSHELLVSSIRFIYLKMIYNEDLEAIRGNDAQEAVGRG